jgi:nucleoid DNA-binding protein
MAAKKPAKAAPKKAAAKKAAPKKAAAKAAPKKPAKPTPVTSRWGKSQILNEIAARAEVSRKQATAMLEELGSIIGRHIHKNGPGQFVLPGMFRVTVKHKPAQKAGMRKNPFTGQMTMGKAKPASRSVRVRPLKKLKDLAN